MPVTAELAQRCASKSDVAVVVIGRLAGEDRDSEGVKGAYYLSDEEDDMLKNVCEAFDKVAVIVNSGNIIDMSWVRKYNPQAVLYCWQGGCESGNGVADVLTGKITPSGRLSDTIAVELSDYPSAANYGNAEENIYAEDIYVGYRYFETFCREKVLYPFGFGLSYTTFSMETTDASVDDSQVRLRVNVTNTGNVSGKETVMVFVEAPQGKLGQPSRKLIGFQKTGLLDPGQAEEMDICMDLGTMASYDDTGVTGHKACFVLEKGSYHIYVGSDVRNARQVWEYAVRETKEVERLEQALAPVKSFQRMKPEMSGGSLQVSYQDVLPGEVALLQKDRDESFAAYTGDKGYKLKDVYDGKIPMAQFLAQLSDQDLITLSCGEGMCPSGVTPGVAGSFGGLTDQLKHFGIPAGCCADGPSGIRMDCGTIAFSLPCGTALACTYNVELVSGLFEYLAMELLKNDIDTILGPGMNVHRNSLCGRNFEYFSEDPLLGGKMAAAQLNAMEKYKVTGTCKHFACNNQEFMRNYVDAVISERALREIYLKPFEIAVREGHARSIMTSYNPVNGVHSASNYDLLTLILRKQWGYKGMVMTDWWAQMNFPGKEAGKEKQDAMILAQNDLYMVTANAADNPNNEEAKKGLEEHIITRYELARNAANICEFFLSSFRMTDEDHTVLTENKPVCRNEKRNEIVCGTLIDKLEIDTSKLLSEKGFKNVLRIEIPNPGKYKLHLEAECKASDLAQHSVSISISGGSVTTFSSSGSTPIRKDMEFYHQNEVNAYVELFFCETGLLVKNLYLEAEAGELD